MTLTGNRDTARRWRRALWTSERAFEEQHEPDEVIVLAVSDVLRMVPPEHRDWVVATTAAQVRLLECFIGLERDGAGDSPQATEAESVVVQLKTELERASQVTAVGARDDHAREGIGSLEETPAARTERTRRSTLAEWLPQGRLDALRQLVLFSGAYYAYRVMRGFADGSTETAFANARSIIDVERSLGLYFEPGLQDFAIKHYWLVDLANYVYVNSTFMVTATFLIWLYLARNHAFYYVRNMFMIAMGLALALFVLFPTAPPRLLPEEGFMDTVAQAVGPASEATVSVLYNPYAGVPAMHVAFALMVAIPAMKLVQSRQMRFVWGLYPAVVTLCVLITANHFWIDAAGGAAVAAIAAVAANGLALALPSWDAPEIRIRLGFRLRPEGSSRS